MIARAPKSKDDETSMVERHLRAAFPTAEVEAYRYNPASIRVRVIDERFRGMSRIDRHDSVVQQIDLLPEDVALDVSVIIPLTRDELAESHANFEFEHPSPSTI